MQKFLEVPNRKGGATHARKMYRPCERMFD